MRLVILNWPTYPHARHPFNPQSIKFEKYLKMMCITFINQWERTSVGRPRMHWSYIFIIRVVSPPSYIRFSSIPHTSPSTTIIRTKKWALFMARSVCILTESEEYKSTSNLSGTTLVQKTRLFLFTISHLTIDCETGRSAHCRLVSTKCPTQQWVQLV